jgi:hypothetical protein
MKRMILMTAAIGALGLAACGEQTAGETQAVADSGACDRACLTALLDQYLAALDAGDASALPVAEGLRFTEDQTDRAFGSEGVWAGDVALTDYRFDIIDVQEGIAASLVKLEENGTPVLMALRLLTQDGRITGVESFVVRSAEEGMIFNIDAIQTLSDGMAYTPAAEQRNTREEMIDAAARYPEGLKVGSFVTSDVPFSADAYRFENGQLMAGPGCTFIPGCDNIREQGLPTLAQIEYQIAAVDQEQGVVLVRMDFGPGSIFPAPGRPDDQSLSVFEAFKVYDGQVHAVEAFMEMKPADQPLGWE